MRYALMVVCIGLLTTGASAETLVDQLWIVDNYAYDQGVVANVIGGWSLTGGENHDSQVVDDFTVGGAGCVITDVWFDYFSLLGGGAPPTSLIEIFADVDNHPGEDAIAYALTATTSTSWTPIFMGLNGERHHASGLDIELGAGHYYISMQPITAQGWNGNGDIYYAVQDTDITPPAGGDSFLREPGIDPDLNHDGSLGFGPFHYSEGLNVSDFISMQAEGFGAGNSSFRVDGDPLQVPGDANGDGKVDGTDLAIWQQNYDPLGDGNNTFALGDWNDDGKVDGTDLAIWQQNYDPLGSGGIDGMDAAVPEPATLLLLGSGMLGAAAAARRRAR